MALLNSITVKIRADVSGLTTGLAAAEAAMRRTGRSMAALGQTMAATLTLPMLAFGAASAKVAGDFQSAMLRVQAMSGATGSQLRQLRDAAFEMGATTKFSAQDAAEALNFMATAGYDATTSLQSLPYVLQLAAAAGLQMGRSSEIVTNILAGYQIQASELAHVNDVLVAAFVATNTNLTDLGEALKYVGPVAASAGLQFEEVTAALGLMGNAGIQGSMAGTSLRAAISRLLQPTDDIRAALDAAGLQMTDAEGRLVSLIEIVRQLEPHANDAGLMMTLFGQRAGPAFAALAAQGAGALERLTVQLEVADGTAERIADTYNQGLNGALSALSSAIEGVGIAFGDSGLLDLFTGLTNRLAETLVALSELSPVWLRAIAAIAGIAAAIGPALFLIGRLQLAFAGLLAALAGPQGLLVVLAGLAVAAVGVLWFRRLSAEAAGLEDAMRRTQQPMDRLTQALREMAAAGEDTRDSLREVAEAQLEVLRQEAQAAEGRAVVAEGRARRWNVPGGMIGDLFTGDSNTAARARAEANAIRAQVGDAENRFFDESFAPQRASEFDRAYQAFVHARSQPGFDLETWRRRNPRLWGILARGRGGAPAPRGGVVPELDILDLGGVGGMPGVETASQSRANEIATLRSQLDSNAGSTRELQRAADIQEAMNAAARDGEELTRAQAEAYVDERDKLQGLVAEMEAQLQKQSEQKQASEEFRVELARSTAEQDELTAAMARGVEEYQRTLEAQRLLRENPWMTPEEARQLADGIVAQARAMQEAQERMQRFAQLWSDIGQAFGSAFEKAILDGERLGDVLRSLARDIAALVLRATVTQPLANMISNLLSGGGSKGGGGGGFWGSVVSGIGSLFSGFFADGGFVAPGKWGIAGENGPEPVFGGKTGATVVANDAGGGLVIDARAYINAQGADPAAIARLEARLAQRDRELPSRIRSEVANLNQRGRGWS